jgi:hypothetical protein
VNFAFRGACNRCGSARPAGASGVAGGGGRGRGRSGPDAGGIGRPAGATAGLFGPNDWPCPMYDFVTLSPHSFRCLIYLYLFFYFKFCFSILIHYFRDNN